MRKIPVVISLCLVLFMFCRAREAGKPADPAQGNLAAIGAAGGNSASPGPNAPLQARDKGIGPVKELNLGPIDSKLAAQGKKLFEDKCTSCHALSKNMAGPALGAILKSETSEFVMNMILNTAEMVQKNETIKKAVAKFGMSMPPPGLSEDQARAILEYLRTTGK